MTRELRLAPRKAAKQERAQLTVEAILEAAAQVFERHAVKCASPLVLTHLAPGKHRFSVYAVDGRPVADATPAQATFRTK